MKKNRRIDDQSPELPLLWEQIPEPVRQPVKGRTGLSAEVLEELSEDVFPDRGRRERPKQLELLPPEIFAPEQASVPESASEEVARHSVVPEIAFPVMSGEEAGDSGELLFQEEDPVVSGPLEQKAEDFVPENDAVTGEVQVSDDVLPLESGEERPDWLCPDETETACGGTPEKSGEPIRDDGSPEGELPLVDEDEPQQAEAGDFFGGQSVPERSDDSCDAGGQEAAPLPEKRPEEPVFSLEEAVPGDNVPAAEDVKDVEIVNEEKKTLIRESAFEDRNSPEAVMSEDEESPREIFEIGPLSVGERLRSMRVKKEMTLQQVASRLCTSQTNVEEMENGHKRADHYGKLLLERLCKVYEVPSDELLQDFIRECPSDEVDDDGGEDAGSGGRSRRGDYVFGDETLPDARPRRERMSLPAVFLTVVIVGVLLTLFGAWGRQKYQLWQEEQEGRVFKMDVLQLLPEESLPRKTLPVPRG